MKKIISLLLVICTIFTLVGCSQKSTNENATVPISENSIIQKLSFDVNEDDVDAITNAMSYLPNDVAPQLGLEAYLTINNEVWLTNDYEKQSNPFEELRYTVDIGKRILKYRYMCKDEFDKFDKEYVKNQIKIIYDIDLNEFEFDDAVDGLIEKREELKENQVFPISFNTGNEISIVLGLSNVEDGEYLSIVATYQVVEIDMEVTE